MKRSTGGGVSFFAQNKTGLGGFGSFFHCLFFFFCYCIYPHSARFFSLHKKARVLNLIIIANGFLSFLHSIYACLSLHLMARWNSISSKPHESLATSNSGLPLEIPEVDTSQNQ